MPFNLDFWIHDNDVSHDDLDFLFLLGFLSLKFQKSATHLRTTFNKFVSLFIHKLKATKEADAWHAIIPIGSVKSCFLLQFVLKLYSKEVYKEI